MIYEYLGFIAAFLTTSSFVPQVIKTITTKNTKGISLIMYVFFTIGVVLWLIYGIHQKDYPITIANAFGFIFSSIILIYKLRNIKLGESI